MNPIRDHHNHVSLYAALGGAIDLSGARSENEALDLLSGFDRAAVTVAIGWHGGRYGFTASRLDAFPPLVVVNVSLHGFVLNRAAEAALGPTFPGIVRHWRDPLWCETRLPQILVFLTRTAGIDAGKLAAFMASMAAMGVDRVDDMLIPGESFLDLVDGSPFAGRIRSWASPEVFAGLGPRGRDRVDGVKLFADGALGMRTAALAAGYPDGSAGLLVHSDAGLEAALRRAAASAKAVSVHAIGDRALAQVVTVLEQLSGEGCALPRLRIEHAQFIDCPLAVRARRLGVTLSMQPNFSSDSEDYADRLSETQRRANNPFRMLIDEVGYRPGEDLLFGSDGMPHGRLSALRACLGPPYESQRLSLDEFRAGYGG
ncbi:MAG: amidohydrolase family protein [Acidobacteria bacterium]|nr:amidohydrolase family protein [Acidobacteriota bacterium]